MSTDSAARPAGAPATGAGIDPRGPQLAAGITSVVLAVALLLGDSPVALVLLGVQAAVFAVGAAAGPQHAPYGWVFRTLVRPRLQPPTELEDPEPPRFAQAVGLGFVVVALAAYLLGATLVGQVAVGFALVAALLNAVFAFCLGCEVYLLLKRATA
ncbi:hypothetical protein QE364_002750 [Nocardioides zeae]|uniref:DUF4395 domain-containing protein n=2 Tax=Nocardioides zeae TaxID=1457234 RepID=A0AAJ1U275_9ACTN|nr:DUF4395 domain-containing protein [Nocardioides zeae]MDQ1106711.1 hypothetical protein [Nocardioides zeae]MDR6173625.1 hypothetical protein [Nocardioides zeae]MDR6211031.1 hypothetical protein [Nocardioides zeae]